MYDVKAVLKQLPRTEDGRISSLIIQGRPGIGKTHFAQALVPKGAPIVRIPMATRTAEDFGSYPLPVRDKVTVLKRDANGNVMTDGEGNELTTEKEVFRVEQALSESTIEPLMERNIGDGYGVLVLDDVTLGDPRLQSAVLEVVQFGVIANDQIGRNVIIVLTGNTTADGAYAVEWSKPLLGRCMLVNLEPNFDIWCDLDDNQNIEPVVLGFLKDHGSFFAPEVGDDDTTDESGKTPSPRDWTRLGLAFSGFGGYKKFEPSIIAQSIREYSNCFVGTKAGAAFAQYANNFGVYPTGQELFDSEDAWKRVPEDRKDMLSGAIAVIFALRNHAIKLLNDKLSDKKACHEIVKTMFDRTRLVASENREVIAYMVKYFVSWATDEANRKDRINVVDATAGVMTSTEYRNDRDFKDFLDALWKLNNK
jgi:hypothetical protein